MGGIVLSEVAKDLIINIINIVVLFIIVKALVYKPVKKFLDERTQRVENTVKLSEEKLAEAQDTVDKRDSIIKSGESRANEIISEAEDTARNNANTIIAQANKTAEQIIDKSRQNAEYERETMLDSAKGEIAQLALDISKQILRREVNADDNKNIIDGFFAKDGEEQ